jgi:hypothetical protein
MAGRRETVEGPAGPRRITVDEARLRRAIQDPAHEPVTGYPRDVMPAGDLDPAALDAVVAYLKTLP